MNPAYSVILFTTASGAGYGLLALLGFVGFNHGPASSFIFGLVAIVIALGLITIGLLSSTFHLGHPERAWRAFSQWRSSWLSREGVAAVVTYGPAVLLFAQPGWISFMRLDWPAQPHHAICGYGFLHGKNLFITKPSAPESSAHRSSIRLRARPGGALLTTVQPASTASRYSRSSSQGQPCSC
jgi:hypothetical protein